MRVYKQTTNKPKVKVKVKCFVIIFYCERESRNGRCRKISNFEYTYCEWKQNRKRNESLEIQARFDTY